MQNGESKWEIILVEVWAVRGVKNVSVSSGLQLCLSVESPTASNDVGMRA